MRYKLHNFFTGLIDFIVKLVFALIVVAIGFVFYTEKTGKTHFADMIYSFVLGEDPPEKEEEEKHYTLAPEKQGELPAAEQAKKDAEEYHKEAKKFARDASKTANDINEKAK